MSGPYDDIIDLPHPTSEKHPRMSMLDRAAQFSPFAALSGHAGAIRETARLTDAKVELSEEEKLALDRKLQILSDRLSEHPEVSIVYFQADERKEGGAYVTAAGSVKKIDNYQNIVVIDGGIGVPIEDIFEIQSPIFAGIEG